MFEKIFIKIDKKKVRTNINNFISYIKIFTLLAVLWIVFSGSKDKFLIVCGIISVVFSFIICKHLKLFSTNSYIIKLSFFRYLYKLFRDLISSSIKMIKIIYSNKLEINPSIVEINTEKLTNQEKVLFSNLITMTPGTFVIAVEGNNFLIHVLNRKDLSFENNKKILNLLKKIDNGK